MVDSPMVPKKDGLKRVRAHLEDILDRPPTDELAHIINENNRLIDEEHEDDGIDHDRAARSDEKTSGP